MCKFYSWIHRTIRSSSSQSANTTQYSLLIIGRILLGFGSIVIEITQNKLYAHWFAGSTLSFVVALDLAWNSLTSIIARLSAVPMSRLNGWYGWALWIPSFVIMFCTLIVIGYMIFEKKVPEIYRPKKGYQTTQLKGMARWKFAIISITQL
jgi:MFS family permease